MIGALNDISVVHILSVEEKLGLQEGLLGRVWRSPGAWIISIWFPVL